jgi:hypothetical protein
VTTATGILYRGTALPGTGWVMRDPAAWWADGERGTCERTVDAPEVLVGHWTGGRMHTGPDSACRVVRAMKARLREDGSPMAVGVHFIIGADGITHQTADLAHGTIHVSRDWNRRGVGVELCWPGTERQARRLGYQGGGVLPRRVAGRGVRVYEPPDEQIAAWVRLAETLTAHLPIPRVVPAAAGRMTRAEARRWRGGAEHLHSASTRKVDAAGLLCDALAGAGWARV